MHRKRPSNNKRPQPRGLIARPNATCRSSRSAVVVDSAGGNICPGSDGAYVSARCLAAASGWIPLPACMANRKLHAWAFFAMVRSCVTAGYILRLCAHRAHVAAHDADDGGAASDFAGRAAHPYRARIAPVCRSRVRRAAPQAALFVVLFVLACAGFAVLSGLSADDDDQVPRASQQAGPFAITVYGPAGDIPVGRASFEVLVQDRTSHEVLLDSEVDVALNNRQAADAPVQRVRAIPGDENELLFSADVDFDNAGARVLVIEVRQSGRSGTLSVPMEVVKSEPGTSLRWSYVVILALAGVLWGVYLWRHRIRISAELTVPVT